MKTHAALPQRLTSARQIQERGGAFTIDRDDTVMYLPHFGAMV